MTTGRSSTAPLDPVLVVGAGGGIGSAVACAFAREGARLALVGRTRARLEATAAECSVFGCAALVIEADVSDADAVEGVVARVGSELGPVAILVNAAGIQGPVGPMHDTDTEAWRRTLEVNLVGPYLLCRAVVPGMLRRGGGRILLFAGGGSTSPRPMFSAYAAAKAGVVRLAETLASELEPSNIQVNAIAPGLVDTGLLDDVVAAGARAGMEHERILAVRRGEIDAVPAELAAELAVFLGLHAAPALTGRLVSAPHDPWRDWGVSGVLPRDGLYTLRRLDPYTLEAQLAVKH